MLPMLFYLPPQYVTTHLSFTSAIDVNGSNCAEIITCLSEMSTHVTEIGTRHTINTSIVERHT